ncbi:Lrp/AsnC family transcriptional regulator [Subtercola frigoramans]|uniref:DNA-binding Lrp family transcriptional regulator n=1 Tax=Subtercola frigoramans TaxID=120298 RepID=A0ABS2L136_9MICO|nr:Lrp/AsnC family transcriptional regulator [Subtercola frigoramans]MBM7470792.1 DNA-binding Lrp family transcriptional regulator [Subtercola frigoramans]
MTDDEIDATILEILIDDGRASGSEVVRRVDAPAWRVRSRLASLLGTEGMRVTAFIDPVLIGRPIVAMLDISSDDPGALPDILSGLDGVAWIARCESGRVYAQVSMASTRDLMLLLDDHVRAIPAVSRVATNLLLKGVTRPLRGSAQGEPARPFTFLGGSPVQIDDIDRLMIVTLQRDGRTPFTELSSLTGLSVPAVRQRFQRLVRTGTLSVVARPWPSMLGRMCTAHLAVRTIGKTAPLVEVLAVLPDVTFVAECAGDADLLIEVSSANRERLETQAAIIRGLPGVGRVIVDPHVDVRATVPHF